MRFSTVKSMKGWERILNVYALIMGLALLYPTVQLLIVGLTDDIVFPPRHFTLSGFNEILWTFWVSIWYSLRLGFFTTVILLFICLPLSYALERYKFKGHTLVSALVFVPYIFPGVAYMSAMFIYYLFYLPFLSGNFTGVLLATLLGNTVLMTRALQSSLSMVDPVYEEAAMTMGAGRLLTFFKVTFPQMIPGIVTGCMIVFTNSATAFMAPFYLGRGITTATVQLFRDLEEFGLTPYTALQALIVEFIVMSIVILCYIPIRKKFKGLSL